MAEKPDESKVEEQVDAMEVAKEEKPEAEDMEVTKEEAQEEGKQNTGDGDANEEAPPQETKDESKEEDVQQESKGEANAETKVGDQTEAEGELKEAEENAAPDERAKVAANSVSWSTTDSTLNVMHVSGGSLLMSVSGGGFRYLLAGVRATAGVKAGRYMFELKIVESLSRNEPPGTTTAPAPRNLVRIGVSLGGSSLFLAETADSVCFDSEGYFFHGKKRSKAAEKFQKGQTVALVINMDEKSPHSNTVSLFRDGQRISQPQKLPDAFAGKALFPTVTYKNVTMHTNFGPARLASLPFSCRMLQDAASCDLELVAAAPSDPCEVVFPIGLPEQGVFDFVDSYLEQHPKHIEVSDRKILEWASKSGIWRPKGYSHITSNDKPDMNFGIPLLDNLSVGTLIADLAPALRRNYVMMELRGNLLADERKKALAQFSGLSFKKKALVLVGEPPEEYKQKVQELILAEKSAKAEAEKRKKGSEGKESRKTRGAKKNNGTEDNKEDMDIDETEEAKMEDPPTSVVELSAEEKQLWYRKSATPDISEKLFAKSYAGFTLPTEAEGFDEISYVWQAKDKCEVYLRDWLLEQKRTQKAEDLEPSSWFKEQYETWKKTLQEWKKKQSEYKDPVKRKAAQKKKEEEKSKKHEAKEGEAVEGEEKVETQPEPTESAADIEVDLVEHVDDIGSGEPLFSNFVYEDWTLLSLRFELHLLIHAFRKDLNDPDRPSFREQHLAYYYDKYFKKSLNLKNYGVDALADFLEMLEDSIALAENGMFESKLPEETEHSKFVKLAEEHRRDRARRVDAGDETALLKFKKPAPPPPRQPDRPVTRDDRHSQGGDRRSYDKGSSRPTHGGSSSNAPPSRYGGSSHGGSYSHGSGGGGSSYGSQKRSYGSSSYPPAKDARTSSYSSGSGSRGYGRGGGGGGGYGSSYRR